MQRFVDMYVYIHMYIYIYHIYSYIYIYIYGIFSIYIRDLLQRDRECRDHFICNVLCAYVKMMYDSCGDSS